MADISKLNLTGTDMNIKDAVVREKLTVVDPTEGSGLITFGVDANGNYGYKKVGADTVTPFLSGAGGNANLTDDIFASFDTFDGNVEATNRTVIYVTNYAIKKEYELENGYIDISNLPSNHRIYFDLFVYTGSSRQANSGSIHITGKNASSSIRNANFNLTTVTFSGPVSYGYGNITVDSLTSLLLLVPKSIKFDYGSLTLNSTYTHLKALLSIRI